MKWFIASVFMLLIYSNITTYNKAKISEIQLVEQKALNDNYIDMLSSMNKYADLLEKEKEDILKEYQLLKDYR